MRLENESDTNDNEIIKLKKLNQKEKDANQEMRNK